MVNKVILLGNVGKDPIERNVGEYKLAVFSLATSKKIKDKEVTQWHNCQAWGKLAEFVLKYVKKGTSLYLEGEILYDKNDDKTYTNINCQTIRMFGSKPKDDNYDPFK